MQQLVDRLLGRSARQLFERGAFDSAAELARAASDHDLAILSQFRGLLATARWDEALRMARTHLVRRVGGAELRIAAIEALRRAPDSDAAIAPLVALIREDRDDLVAGGLYLVACAVAGRAPELALFGRTTVSAAVQWLMDDCDAETILGTRVAAAFQRTRCPSSPTSSVRRPPTSSVGDRRCRGGRSHDAIAPRDEVRVRSEAETPAACASVEAELA